MPNIFLNTLYVPVDLFYRYTAKSLVYSEVNFLLSKIKLSHITVTVNL